MMVSGLPDHRDTDEIHSSTVAVDADHPFPFSVIATVDFTGEIFVQSFWPHGCWRR